MTLDQNYDTSSDDKQSSCEERTSNVSPQERYRYELCNFFLFKWLWTCSNDLGSKLLHTLRRYAILCEVGTSYVTLKEGFGQTRIMHFSLQWPWTCPKDLWFNSWHALTLEVIIVW